MNLPGMLTYLVGLLDFWPDVKSKLGALAAFALAVVAAWNDVAPQIGVDFVLVVPGYITAIVMALIGVGASNANTRLAKRLGK